MAATTVNGPEPSRRARYGARVRALDWDGYPNCRDLGGLPTPSGPTRTGRIARGPRRELLTTTGWAQARRWGLRTVVDLRCADEVGRQDGDPTPEPTPLQSIELILAPTEDHANLEFRKTCFPILDSPEYWPHNLRILPDLVLRTLEAIAAATPGVLVHCSAGRDRTGMITALLLANAGVAPELIADDYAESVRAMAGTRSNSPTPDRQTRWGPTEVATWLAETRPLVVAFARRIDEHLEEIGLRHAQRDRLRSLLLSPGRGDRGVWN